VLLEQAECFAYFTLGKTGSLGQFDGRLKPELGFTTLALNMHMHSRLFPREEVETEAAFAENRWTHEQDDTRNTCPGKPHPTGRLAATTRVPGSRRLKYEAPTEDMIRRIDAEAAASLENIKRAVEARRGGAP